MPYHSLSEAVVGAGHDLAAVSSALLTTSRVFDLVAFTVLIVCPEPAWPEITLHTIASPLNREDLCPMVSSLRLLLYMNNLRYLGTDLRRRRVYFSDSSVIQLYRTVDFSPATVGICVNPKSLHLKETLFPIQRSSPILTFDLGPELPWLTRR